MRTTGKLFQAETLGSGMRDRRAQGCCRSGSRAGPGLGGGSWEPGWMDSPGYALSPECARAAGAQRARDESDRRALAGPPFPDSGAACVRSGVTARGEKCSAPRTFARVAAGGRGGAGTHKTTPVMAGSQRSSRGVLGRSPSLDTWYRHLSAGNTVVTAQDGSFLHRAPGTSAPAPCLGTVSHWAGRTWTQSAALPRRNAATYKLRSVPRSVPRGSQKQACSRAGLRCPCSGNPGCLLAPHPEATPGTGKTQEADALTGLVTSRGGDALTVPLVRHKKPAQPRLPASPQPLGTARVREETKARVLSLQSHLESGGWAPLRAPLEGRGLGATAPAARGWGGRRHSLPTAADPSYRPPPCSAVLCLPQDNPASHHWPKHLPWSSLW